MRKKWVVCMIACLTILLAGCNGNTAKETARNDTDKRISSTAGNTETTTETEKADDTTSVVPETEQPVSSEATTEPSQQEKSDVSSTAGSKTETAKSYDSTFTTDKNGEISVDGLRIGEYTVSEVSDNVSAGYILPADKKVTVKVGETVEIEMHNELRDTPKTGDDRKTGLWVALAGASALGIVATVVASKRKKKKEGNE